MKKKIIISIILLLAIGAGGIYTYYKTGLLSAYRFKHDVEKYNNQMKPNSEVFYPYVAVPTDNPVKYVSEKDAVEFLDKGTGAILFGFPNCPWCRNLIPVLLNVATDMKINQIKYLDIYNIRDTKTLGDDLSITTTKEGTASYFQLLNKLDLHLNNYTLTDSDGNKHDTGEKRLLAPTIVFVKSGNIMLVNEATVKSHIDKGDGYSPMTDEEKAELYSILKNGFDLIYAANPTQGC